jgi:hypothetical protein
MSAATALQKKYPTHVGSATGIPGLMRVTDSQTAMALEGPCTRVDAENCLVWHVGTPLPRRLTANDAIALGRALAALPRSPLVREVREVYFRHLRSFPLHMLMSFDYGSRNPEKPYRQRRPRSRRPGETTRSGPERNALLEISSDLSLSTEPGKPVRYLRLVGGEGVTIEHGDAPAEDCAPVEVEVTARGELSDAVGELPAPPAPRPVPDVVEALADELAGCPEALELARAHALLPDVLAAYAEARDPDGALAPAELSPHALLEACRAAPERWEARWWSETFVPALRRAAWLQTPAARGGKPGAPASLTWLLTGRSKDGRAVLETLLEGRYDTVRRPRGGIADVIPLAQRSRRQATPRSGSWAIAPRVAARGARGPSAPPGAILERSAAGVVTLNVREEVDVKDTPEGVYRRKLVMRVVWYEEAVADVQGRTPAPDTERVARELRLEALERRHAEARAAAQAAGVRGLLDTPQRPACLQGTLPLDDGGA